MILRGVEFRGSWFDDFEPGGGVDAALGFRWHHGDLADCVIGAEMPVATAGGDREATLQVRLDLAIREYRGGQDEPNLTLRLGLGDDPAGIEGRGQTFEQALLRIQAALPAGAALKCCFGCQFSDYNPFGQGLFGCMACYRGCKSAYTRVRGKRDLFEILDRATETVQETGLCPEFEVRTPGMGYRG